MRLLPLCLIAASIAAGARPYTDPEAYRVYEAILPENRAYTDAISVLIRAKTISYPYDRACFSPDSQDKPAVDSAAADYQRVNQTSHQLTRLFNLEKSYEILPESEFTGSFPALRNSSRWRQYLMGHSNFPGFIELSAVGFSKDKATAVVYMVRNCGVLCSGGDLIVLQKHAGRWKPSGKRCFWKS